MKLRHHILWWVIIVALLSWLMIDRAWGATTNITSLPYTANQTGTAYSETLTVNGSNLSSATSGINFTGHDIVLNLGSDTITYSTGNGTSNLGLHFNNSYNIRVIGTGWLIDGSNHDTIGYNCDAVQFTGSPHDIYIQLGGIRSKGRNAHCFDSYGVGVGLYHLEINGGDFYNKNYWFDSRCNYDGSVARLETGVVADTNVYIHDFTIHEAYAQGVVIMGRINAPTTSIVYNGTIAIDQKNDKYVTYTACQSSGNSYGVLLRAARSGSIVRKNTIRSGSLFYGGEGILTENCKNTNGTKVLVDSNDVDVHCWNPNTAYRTVYAYKNRSIDGDSTYGVDANNNTLIARGDTLASTNSYGDPIVGAVLGGSPGDSILFHNNTVKAMQYGASGGLDSWALIFDCATGNSINSKFRVYNNHIYSDNILIQPSGQNCGCDSITIWGDTLSWISPRLTGSATYRTRYWDPSKTENGDNNYALDMFYNGGVYDTNIVDRADLNGGFAGGNNIDDWGLRKTLTVTAIGTNWLPIYSAACTVWNAYNQQVLVGQSDSLGQVSGPVTYWFESRTATDSTAFNPFLIHIQKGAEKKSGNMTVAWDKGDTTIYFSSTAGSGWPDTLDVMLTHQSVGNQIVGFGGNIYNDYLDSIQVVVANHYAAIRFRHLNTNYVSDCMSDTNGNVFTFITNSSMGWQGDGGPRYYLNYPPNTNSNIIDQVFGLSAAAKATSQKWSIFLPHYDRYPAGDSTLVDYDLVICKPPYFQHKDATASRMALLKGYWQTILDTLAHHSEAPFVYSVGTPLKYWLDGGGNDFNQDTVEARYVYAFACWAADTFALSIPDSMTWVRVWDSYRPLCETSAVYNKYCLDTTYWDHTQGGSHINSAGSAVERASFTAFIKGAALEILTALYGEAAPAEPEPDTTAPTIADKTITSITTSGAVVGWSTDEACPIDSVTVVGGASFVASGVGTSHSSTLSGLSASTAYDITLISKDASGNRGTADTSFTTAAIPPAEPSTGKYWMLLK